ncbi:predicted protein [Botrytis cinerea T4]|uniref:Uncharacterized protein n=1 Tax=Botryotinia fuckeliana (strain T4) TaxID=999810 RepID=G2XR89_BOTF4|nr:predicted protein [Botrytis cinerea T4]
MNEGFNNTFFKYRLTHCYHAQAELQSVHGLCLWFGDLMKS